MATTKLEKTAMENEHLNEVVEQMIHNNRITENLKYNEIEEWDSIGHMTLVAALEEEFKINN